MRKFQQVNAAALDRLKAEWFADPAAWRDAAIKSCASEKYMIFACQRGSQCALPPISAVATLTRKYASTFFFFFWVTGELSTLRQMMKVPNEPGLSPNNGLENAFLSDQSMASNPRKGQAKRPGAKTTSHDGKAGHIMTHVCHRVRQEERQV